MRQVKSKLSITDRKLIEMLTENTGRALCDSGDAYGRNWQRNQSRNFMAEPATTLEIRKGYDGGAEIMITHNVFHWLRDRLDYDARLTAVYNRFANRPENKDKYHLDLMEEFADAKYTGLYGEGRPMVVNTYNGEDNLSQTLQYVYFEDREQDHENYVLLQIHGGADVRGGYTAPKVFRVMEECAMFDNARGTIWEEPTAAVNQETLPGLSETYADDANWTTDGGCHWYRDGACGLGAGRQLETYEVTEDFEDREGKIYLGADGVAYGPVNGGRLCGGF